MTTTPNQLAKAKGIANKLLWERALDLVVAPLTGNTEITFARHSSTIIITIDASTHAKNAQFPAAFAVS
ncbi:hypothetical protein M973_01980 [Francisella orientalis LADL 07-285A]|nr:hypothetical protein M973_01980 [Francisella orientalis LADL 07-285A]